MCPTAIQWANFGLIFALLWCLVALVLFLRYATFSDPTSVCVYNSEGELKFCM